MTISSVINKHSYDGDGSQTTFYTTFKFFDNSHVAVTHVDSGSVETEWTEGTEYTLSGAGSDDGGVVTVQTSPTDYTPTTGSRLVLTLSPPNTQGTSLPAGGTIKPSAIERMVDLTVQQILAVKENLDRALKAPITENAIGDLPNADTRKGRLLGFDAATGEPQAIAAADVPLVSVTAFVATLLDDADAAAARTTLGAEPADADIAKTDAQQAWTASQRSPFVTDNDGTFDMDAGQNFRCMPAGNVTVQFANEADGQSGFVRLINSGGHTISFGSEVEFAGAAIPSLGLGTHLLGYICDGTNVTVTFASEVG